MDSLGTCVSVVMGCFVLFVVVETIYFTLCCKGRVEGHDEPTAERGLQQKVPLLEHLCWWKRASNGKRLAREDTNNGVCSSSSIKENSFGDEQASSQVVVTLCPYQAEAGYGDWQLSGLLAPPRFLFTIKEEETDQDVDCEDGRSRLGRTSPPLPLVLSPLNKPLSFSPDLLSPSSSFSLSPTISPPHSKPLSAFMQEPPSPLSISTPPRHLHNRTLEAFLQLPPNSSPGLLSHPNRVYPLGAAGMGGDYCPALRKGASMQKQIEGIPIFGNGWKLQTSGGEASSPGTSWSASSPLSSGRSSPFHISSPLQPASGEVQNLGLFFQRQNGGEQPSDENSA